MSKGPLHSGGIGAGPSGKGTDYSVDPSKLIDTELLGTGGGNLTPAGVGGESVSASSGPVSPSATPDPAPSSGKAVDPAVIEAQRASARNNTPPGRG